jgi:DNA adenine methylase
MKKATAGTSGLTEAALKYPGGQGYFSNAIVAELNRYPHQTFIETHAGGAIVTIKKSCEGIAEAINDLDLRVSNFWKVLQDEKLFQKLHRRLVLTPFSQVEFEAALKIPDIVKVPDVEQAAALFIQLRQSFSATQDSFPPMATTRRRRGMADHASAWLSSVDGLSLVHNRMRRVEVFNEPAEKILRRYDKEGVLFYCDPPFHPDVRSAKEFYKFEMTPRQHGELLEQLGALKHAKFALSGRQCPLYDAAAELHGWNRKDMETSANAQVGKTKKRYTASLWMNY